MHMLKKDAICLMNCLVVDFNFISKIIIHGFFFVLWFVLDFIFFYLFLNKVWNRSRDYKKRKKKNKPFKTQRREKIVIVVIVIVDILLFDCVVIITVSVEEKISNDDITWWVK